MKLNIKKTEEVDVFVENKPWSVERQKEFSELLRKKKLAATKKASTQMPTKVVAKD